MKVFNKTNQPTSKAIQMSDIQKKFQVQGQDVSVIKVDLDKLRDELPPAIYAIEFNMFTGFYLTKRFDSFELPEKLFGDVSGKVNRLMKRYKLNNEVSALLSGEKGSGKTLLAHAFCNEALKEGKAVILVEKDFDNVAGLKAFLYDIGNAVFIFDEFAKKFSNEAQQVMLDFFSGSDYTKRATFVIENRLHEVNEFMLDRPGRIRFHFKYGKLPIKVAKEVCEYNKLSEELTRLILNYAARVLTIGMDTLSRIIEECIIDDISTKDEFNNLIDDLNVVNTKQIEYDVQAITFKGEDFTPVGINHLGASARNVSGSFAGAENHPLVLRLLKEAEKDENIKKAIDSVTYTFDECDADKEGYVEGGTYIEWSDFHFHVSNATFTTEGSILFVHRQMGMQFVVVERVGDELGDVLDVL